MTSLRQVHDPEIKAAAAAGRLGVVLGPSRVGVGLLQYGDLVVKLTEPYSGDVAA
jgi:hypothetical protein